MGRETHHIHVSVWMSSTVVMQNSFSCPFLELKPDCKDHFVALLYTSPTKLSIILVTSSFLFNLFYKYPLNNYHLPISLVFLLKNNVFFFEFFFRLFYFEGVFCLPWIFVNCDLVYFLDNYLYTHNIIVARDQSRLHRDNQLSVFFFGSEARSWWLPFGGLFVSWNMEQNGH